MSEDTLTKTAAERLRNARIKAGFASAAAAARHHHWGEAAYRHHENGTRSIGIEQAVAYAKAFQVSASWLLSLGTSGEAVRVPIAKFYLQVYGHNLGEDDAIYQAIDGIYQELGICMVPELSVDVDRFEWIVGSSGRPPMHFIDPSEVDTPSESFSDGYIFAYRVGRRFPQSRLSTGDVLLVDSSVGEARLMPAMYLFRDDVGPFIKVAQRTTSGETLLMPDGPGQIAESASDFERFDVVGKVVWIGQRT